MDQDRWETIQAAFDELVALDDTSRTSRLAELGDTDPELRAAVESLLAADAEASEQLAPLEAGFVAESPTVPDPLNLTGRTISHFQIQERLGAGGMGAVYRAHDARLGREVALKFLLPHFSLETTAKARFLREAHAAAALDHPNLCAVHEVGESDDGRLFLAMALYAGETLRTLLARDGPLPAGLALEIARQIAEGLQSAHAAGIVHRDLKPGNVMLLPDGTVKLLDFGLAKPRGQSITESGVLVGTLAYMAPEQIRGEVVDGRADLWALGVVLYEMLTAREPFGGEEDIAVAQAILHAQPVPPSTHRRDVSAAVENLVLKLLHKEPAGRYATAADLLADLAAVESASLRHSLRRRVRQARRLVSGRTGRMLAGGAAVALIAGGSYWASGLQSGASAVTPARTAIAVLPFRNLSAEPSHAYLADGLHDEIVTQLYKVPALKVIGRTSVITYGGPDPPPLRQIASELGVGSVVEGSVQVVGDSLRLNLRLVDAATEAPLWVEQYDRALDDAFALQRDIAQQIVATVGVVLGGAERDALTQVPTEKAQAYMLYLQGREIDRRPDRSQENLEAAQRLYERAIALDSGFALAHAALSMAHAWMYLLRYDMTAERLARQRAAAETAVRLAPDSPEARRAMGAALNVGPNTNPHAALEQWQLGLRSAPNDFQLIRHTLAFYRQTGNWEEYEKVFPRAVELDPRNVDFLVDYGGDTHMRMGRFADATHWYERAAGITGDTLGLSQQKAWIAVAWKGDTGPLRAWMRGEGGRIARREGWIWALRSFWLLDREPDSVLLVLEDVREPVFQSAFFFEPVALSSAVAHELRGDTSAARAAYDSALVMADSGIRQYPHDFAPHVSRGMALAGLGRRAEALDDVRKIRENYLFKDAWVREWMLIGIARIYALLGDADGTVDNLEQVLKERYTGLTIHHLQLQPAWDRVRGHPRFQALLTRYANHPNVRS